MKVLIFGGMGSIGNHINQKLQLMVEKMYITTSKKEKENIEQGILYVEFNNFESLNTIDKIDGIIWAHGININDNIYNTNKISSTIDTNVIFIVNTLQFLIKCHKINNNANLIIISSIWEHSCRDNKLSYSISKSALSGLVKSLSYDLSFQNILINNICPGPIDNEMTNKSLNKEQLQYIKNYLGFNRLVSLTDIYNLVEFLLFKNTGITGQSINVDLGFINIKKV